MGTDVKMMNEKQWTGAEVKELALLASRKGLAKGRLADHIGIHASTLSVWMAGNRGKELPLLTRNAISFVEEKIKGIYDLPTNKGDTR